MRKVFFSFDWDDVWRVNQVRNSWVSKGSYTNAGFIDSAEIETLKQNADTDIEHWIDEQMHGTSVTCVLIGSHTAKSKWVKYEIEQSIKRKNGLVGIYIHNLKDILGITSSKGTSPFQTLFLWKGLMSESQYPCVCYYDWINDDGYNSLDNWIEKAARQAGR